MQAGHGPKGPHGNPDADCTLGCLLPLTAGLSLSQKEILIVATAGIRFRCYEITGIKT